MCMIQARLLKHGLTVYLQAPNRALALAIESALVAAGWHHVELHDERRPAVPSEPWTLDEILAREG